MTIEQIIAEIKKLDLKDMRALNNTLTRVIYRAESEREDAMMKYFEERN